ncbi:chemotaxis response regulator protein-glutamate methylesterase [bacterium]|nr:MAG: chemotaxis response regulator protein-glutamate methylesterase [bacterium]
MPQPIRVLLAVASPLTLKTLERLLAQAAPDEIEIVGIVRRGRDVLPALQSLRPNVLCLDDAPPAIKGLEVIAEVMRTHPCPILAMGAAPQTQPSPFREAGALDYWPRPDALADSNNAQSLITHLKMLSRVPVIGRRSSWQTPRISPISDAVPPPTSAPISPRLLDISPATLDIAPSFKSSDHIVAIGASTGGPLALMTILSAMPSNFPCPIVCVQHVSQGFLDGLVSWLDGGCRVRVAIAKSGEKAQPGTVLFPPEDQHMEIGTNGRIRLKAAPLRDGHRPSVTVLFESVARSYGPRATAILLTGMGADGASGLCAIRDAGGDTIAQDEASCVVFGMPRVAIERGGARHISSPEEITRRLLMLCQLSEKRL